MSDVTVIRKAAIGLSIVPIILAVFAAGASTIHIAILNALFFLCLVWFGTFLSNNGKPMITGILVLAMAGFFYFINLIYAFYGYQRH